MGSKGSNTSKIIAAAVGVRTWNDANGIPTSDVGYYMDVIDYISGLYSPSFSAVLSNSRLRQF